MVCRIELKVDGRHWATWGFRIAKVRKNRIHSFLFCFNWMFRSPLCRHRDSEFLKSLRSDIHYGRHGSSWNSSMSSQTVSYTELKLDGRHGGDIEIHKGAKIVPFWYRKQDKSPSYRSCAQHPPLCTSIIFWILSRIELFRNLMGDIKATCRFRITKGNQIWQRRWPSWHHVTYRDQPNPGERFPTHLDL